MRTSVSPIRWTTATDLVKRQRAAGRTRAIRAQHDTEHVLVLQAYRPELGQAAAAAGTLAVPGFSLTRTTWIKPSFLWMMHRSSWGTAQGHEVVLGLHVARGWFESAFAVAELSLHTQRARASGDGAEAPVVVPWDPDWSERDVRQPWRALQASLRPAAVGGDLAAIRSCVDLSEPIARGRESLARGGSPEVADAEILALPDAATRARLRLEGPS